eukprot:12399566-Karenia_brevis.AAC.1
MVEQILQVVEQKPDVHGIGKNAMCIVYLYTHGAMNGGQEHIYLFPAPSLTLKPETPLASQICLASRDGGCEDGRQEHPTPSCSPWLGPTEVVVHSKIISQAFYAQLNADLRRLRFANPIMQKGLFKTWYPYIHAFMNILEALPIRAAGRVYRGIAGHVEFVLPNYVPGIG